MPGDQEEVLSKWQERLAALHNVPPLFRIVWEAARELVVASILIRVVAALLPLAMLAITRFLIDSISNLTAHYTPLPTKFWWMVLLEFGFACLAMILGRMIDYCDVVLADRYSHHIARRIMEHASRLDLTAYEDPSFYDSLERARVQGTDRIMMIQASGRLVQQAITTLTLVASIWIFSPWILVVLVLCVVPAFLGETYFALLGYALSFRQTPEKRQMEYLRLIGGSKESIKELKLFGLREFLIDRFSGLSDKLLGENKQLAQKRLLVGSLLTLLGTGGYYGTYALAILKTVRGELTLGTLTFLAGAIAGASANIQALFSTFSSIADQALFLNDLLAFFQVKPKIVSKPNAIPAPRPIQTGFEFRNVSFSYPGNPRPVLKNINFKLRPNERIALVGENGQGKTTIVKLMTRLYEVSGGQILLDGIDIREYDLEDLWREVGVIFQDFVKYEMSVNDNIAVGRVEKRGSTEEISSAASRSMAEEIIERLPNRYDQVLGSRFEGAMDLSGGEWQRVALARAYLRDAQVLVLDEPTAALDARSEHEVFERFAELTQGKMSLFISHRFSTVRMADRILVLADGTIEEQGQHDQLVEQGGRYAEMFELQAAHYR